MGRWPRHSSLIVPLELVREMAIEWSLDVSE